MKRALLVAAVISALAPLPAGAWTRQRLYSGGVAEDQGVAIAGNARGDAAVAFVDGSGIRLALARPGRPFGRSRSVLGSDGGRAPQLAMDASGNVLVTWSYFDETEVVSPDDPDAGCCSGGRMTVRSARTGHFRRVQNLTPRGRDVGIDAIAIVHGRVAVAWSEPGAGVHVRAAARGHRLGREAEVDSGYYGEALGVVPARSGAVVTYARYDVDRTAIREFRLWRGQAVRERTLVRGLPEFATVATATNAGGAQVASWWTDSNIVYAGVRRIGRPFRITRLGPRGIGEPSAAISPSGRAAVGWSAPNDRLKVTTAARGQPVGRGRIFKPPRRYGSLDGLAINDAGRVVLEWAEFPKEDPVVVAGFRSPRGRGSQRVRLGPGLALPRARLAVIDARGRARVAWLNNTSVSVARAR